ncbi:MAG TPA: cytochrome P450 [Polyangiales bacterium]|nr:cytochrome P450 [Polyangiales bacterium]
MSSSIPRDPTIDSTLALWREGYEFIWNRCRRFDTDLFATRVMGRKTLCIHGVEAAALFYDESKFERHGALPRRVVTSLFGKGAVHTLDDAAHRQRKAAFMSLMSPVSLQRLMDEAAQCWRRAIRGWQYEKSVVLLDETQRILTEAVCNWAGVPLRRGELARRARDLSAMVDAFGGVGPRLWRGKAARMRTERWIGRCIDDVRRRRLYAAPNSALYVMAHLLDSDRRPLDTKTAAVELINVLRPTVAVSWYIAFAAHALHEHPEAREKIAREKVGEGAGEYADLFMQEVRRFYPFTPFLGARVRSRFEWRGQTFEPGTLVLLDVHGTDHDPKLWDQPETFRPERFRSWNGSAFDFIPQGGGQHATGHRCPGEWITMHNLVLALHFLTRCMSYQVAPRQDLSIDLTRMPTQPASGVVIRHVRATEGLDRPAPRLPSLSAERGLESRVATVAAAGAA